MPTPTRGVPPPLSLFAKIPIDFVVKPPNLITDMTLAQFQKAFAIANDTSIDLSTVDDTILFGCGLPRFEPVHTTLEAVAKLIRWQAMQFNGEWNSEALNEVTTIGRRKFMILN